MSAQVLGAKALRRIERSIGEPVARGWAYGGYTFLFVTPDHRHGWWSKRDGSWGPESNPLCFSSCRGLPPLTQWATPSPQQAGGSES